jgi:hypothetical protein
MISLLFATVAAQKGLCPVLLEDFNSSTIDPKVWRHDITLGGGGNWEFQVIVF